MFKLQIRTANAAFEDGDTAELARILKEVAVIVRDEERTHGVVFDVNGARVGAWSLEWD